jgi:hypothetical protein
MAEKWRNDKCGGAIYLEKLWRCRNYCSGEFTMVEELY